MSEFRYHFMYSEKDIMTGELIMQFMDFQGARLVRCTIETMRHTENEQLRLDARAQWPRIKNSLPVTPKRPKR